MPFGVSLIYGVDAKFLGHGIQQYSKLCGYNTLSVKGKALRSDLVQSSNNLRTSSLICALENLRSGKSDDGTGTSSGSGTNPGISGVAERGRDYFWRGFTSPVGDAVGRASKRDGRGASGSGSSFGGGPGPGPKRHQQHKHLHSPYGPGSFRGRAKKN
jgi:hypothetical protein